MTQFDYLARNMFAVPSWDERLLLPEEFRHIPPQGFTFLDFDTPGVKWDYVAVPRGDRWEIVRYEDYERSLPQGIFRVTYNLVNLLTQVTGAVTSLPTGGRDLQSGTTYWVQPYYAPSREWRGDITGSYAFEPVLDSR